MDDSKTNDEVLLRFDKSGSDRAVVLEDDGRVAYAYLLDGEDMVSDAWLYNVADAPKAVDWDDPSQMPFLNPESFCDTKFAPRLTHKSSVECIWFEEGVEVVIDGVLMARLKPGAKPGWSRLALRPGPLAKPLESRA